MPRDSNGAYSLPPIYLATTGQTVLAEQHNTPLTDIAAALTGSLPRNGTGSMLANLPMGSYRITNLADGTAGTDAATVSQAAAAGVPIGAVLDFAGSQAPTGYLLCFGQAVSRATYADLFTAIGTTYGSGDGSTTFNVPDYRGRVLAGKDNMGGTAASRLTNSATGGVAGSVLGATGGEEAHTLTAAETPAHTHGVGTLATALAGSHTHSFQTGATDNGRTPPYVDGGNVGSYFVETSAAGAHTHALTGSTASYGSGGVHNNVQPTIIANKIIRALAA